MELITHEQMNNCIDGGGVVWNHLGSRERADAKVLFIYLFGVYFFSFFLSFFFFFFFFLRLY